MILKSLILTIIFNISLLACAGGWDYNQKEFIFLEKREMPFSNISEDTKAPDVYNTIIWKYEQENKKRNLQEWKTHIKESLSINELEECIYKRKNLEKIKDKEILDYLNFVKEQEEHVVFRYFYSKQTQKSEPNYDELIKKALDKLEKTKSSWLKLRYFYLALRLAHYKKKNPLVIYDKYKYLLNNDDKTIVKDWIQGLYAGALVKDKQVEKGVYEFTKLFDESKINWHLSYYNFHHIKTNEQWEKLLNFAKNDEEKTKLFAIRALNPNSNALEELQNIYQIDKNSKWFDFVLYRKLLDTQHFFDQNEFMERKIVPYKKYINFLKTIDKRNMYLVDLTLGYFNLYSKNLNDASKIDQELLKKYPNSHEVQTFDYILYLEKLNKVDLKTENIIYEKMKKLISKEHNSDSIHNYTFVILKKLYAKQNDRFKEFLASNITYLDSSAFDLPLLEKFNEFLNSKKQSKIEEHFFNKYLELKIIEKKDNNIVLSSSLKTAQVKLLISNLKFEEALKINSKYLNEKVQFNPFNGLISGNNRKGKQYTLTIKEFLEKIITIKNELVKNPNSVMDNYLYANALYNLSYFGNSNILTTVHRSVYSFNDIDLQKEKINQASKYYKKALKDASKKEFKAKIVYMLAKVELASFDINYARKGKDYYYKDLDRFDLNRYWSYYSSKTFKEYIKNDYGKYFDLLKKDYADTKYYSELIKECSNLRVYQEESK